MPRYLTSEFSSPLNNDYYYEANYSTTDYCYPRSHSHNFYELFVFLRDGVEMMIEDQLIVLKRGTIAIIPPYHAHYMIPREDGFVYERAYLWITEHCISSFTFNEFTLSPPLKEVCVKKRYLIDINNEEDLLKIVSLFHKIANSKKLEKTYEWEFLNRSYLLESLALINKHILKVINAYSQPHETLLINKVIGYINDHYMNQLSNDVLAKKFFINRNTLETTFKKYTNLTVHDYLTRKRVNEAKQLILDDVSPSQVYDQCGFNNYPTFYRSFMKLEGISPAKFIELSQNHL